MSTQKPWWEFRNGTHLPATAAGTAPRKVDYVVSGGGTLYLITPQNDAAQMNLFDNLQDDAQFFGSAVVVEHRYIEPLVKQLKEEGWIVE